MIKWWTEIILNQMKSNHRKLLFIATVCALSAGIHSCDVSKKYEKEEKETIQKYLSDNPTLDFELKPSGLYYLEVLAGTGVQPVVHDSVFIKYTGKFLDGFVFETNVGTSNIMGFPLLEGEVIRGFDEGISYMRKGGKSKMLIPSSLAYGPSGYFTIPGFTPLLFDVELIDVKKNP